MKHHFLQPDDFPSAWLSSLTMPSYLQRKPRRTNPDSNSPTTKLMQPVNGGNEMYVQLESWRICGLILPIDDLNNRINCPCYNRDHTYHIPVYDRIRIRISLRYTGVRYWWGILQFNSVTSQIPSNHLRQVGWHNPTELSFTKLLLMNKQTLGTTGQEEVTKLTDSRFQHWEQTSRIVYFYICTRVHAGYIHIRGLCSCCLCSQETGKEGKLVGTQLACGGSTTIYSKRTVNDQVSLF